MPFGMMRQGFTYQVIQNVVASRTPKTITNNGVTFSSAQKQFGAFGAFFGGSATATSPNSSDFYLSNNSYTIEFWFNTADALSEIVNQQSTTRNGWSIGTRSGQRMLFAAGDGSTISVLVPSTGGYSDNTWSHVAICHAAGGGVAIFTNGVRNYYNAGWNVNIAATTANFRMGTGFGVSGGNFTDGPFPYTGYMDEMRISTVDRYGVTNGTIAVPTAGFVNDADTKLLLHMENTVADDGGPA